MDLFIEIVKDACVVIVALQAFVLAALIIFVTVNDKTEGGQEQKEPRIGSRAFCLLTNAPCIYADGGNSCDDCPAVQKQIYTEENNVDKVRGFQDEGRAD